MSDGLVAGDFPCFIAEGVIMYAIGLLGSAALLFLPE